jgi:hypothetical protein
MAAACLLANPPGHALGGTFTTNTYNFTYSNRDALLADGWSFVATSPNGIPRNTEVTAADPTAISYDQASHPGLLRIPPNGGDLWSYLNSTINSLFRNLSSNWVSVRLDVASFQPTASPQQLELALYQDDDNYLEVGRGYSGTFGGQAMHFVREDGGLVSPYSPLTLARTNVSATTFRLRLDRDLATDAITGLYSVDGTNWGVLGGSSQTLTNARLCIWSGGYGSLSPNCDLRRLDIVTSDTPLLPVLVAQPQHLIFNTVAGQTCTNLQQVRVLARRAQSTQGFSAAPNAPWLLTSTAAASTNTPGFFDVGVSTAGLPAGTYERTITCSAPGALPATVTVTLIVNPAARAQVATWRGGKAGAMTVWIDDSQPTAFDTLSANGLQGTYVLWELTAIPSYFSSYYLAGMELGSHTVLHDCLPYGEARTRFNLETNIADICARTLEPRNHLISFAYPCGVTTNLSQVVASDYFLNARGYNFNLLEDPSPYNWMNLKSFNSHEHDPHKFNLAAPPNPADLKTIVDAAVAQGKWFNLVLHTLCNDDGAIAYSVGKDLWVGTAGSVTKYILQRDRTVITNYVETADWVRFNCYRLPLDASSARNFETAIEAQDVLTFQVDLAGTSSISDVTVNGLSAPYSFKLSGGRMLLLVDLPVTPTAQTVVLQKSSGGPSGSPPPDGGYTPRIRNITETPDRRVQFTAAGTPNQLYRIQAGTDLVHWVTIATNVAGTNGLMICLDPAATNYSRRFYRTVSP